MSLQNPPSDSPDLTDQGSTASHPHHASHDDHDLVKRFENTCQDLNTRIARLSIALGVSLQEPDTVAQVMHNAEIPWVLRQKSHGHLEAAGISTHRLDQLWAELRGLMLFRDEMEKRCVDEFGPEVARQILIDTEVYMAHHGFTLGADGMGLAFLPTPPV